MEELFRFTLNRPADRTAAPTLPLERSTFFQRKQLTNRVPPPVAPAARTVVPPLPDPWTLLQQAALGFITDNANLMWIVDLISQAPPSPIPELRVLLAALEAVQSDSQSTAWQTPIQTAASNTKPNDLHDWNDKLADLFLVLLILRSLGPAAIDKLIRDTIKLVAPPPPLHAVPPQLQPAFAEILHDHPSLDEVANLLRMIHLVTNAASIPGPPATPNTADDVKAALTQTLLLPPGIFSRFEKPIHAVGITDLLVVKQHIARYELGEVARIENILKGESRDHTQKHTLSNERDTTVETSTETQTDQELTTTDHVSLQNEIENTLKEDTKIDAGVHVQYDGGSVKAQADLTVGYDKSSSESKKFASNIAKDITQKAAKKVTQKVQQTITTKIIETFEETEDQSFDNKTGPANISGVYQWVEKVYLAQVFSYGKHMLFDIMVPEPAASLLLAAQIPPPDQKVPVPPDPLGTIKKVAGNIQLDEPLRPDQLTDASVANKWIGKFQVTGVEPPPPERITVAKSIATKHEGDIGQVVANDVIQLEDGYAATAINVIVTWLHLVPGFGGGGGDAMLDVSVGEQSFHFDKDNSQGNWGNDFTGSQNYNYPDPPDPNLTPEQGQLAVTIAAVWVEYAAVDIEISCKRTAERFAKWQLATYEKIAAAWQKLQADYEEKISALQFQKGTTGPLGSADPETNRQIERTELKRSCIALLNNSYMYINGSDALVPKTTVWPAPSPTTASLFDPDLTVSETIGSWVRWFEQAFEWDKIGYVFYPYYWGRSSQWADKLFRKNDDPLFLNFLQAGYARVAIPVRNGFEDAMNFYLLTGRPWRHGRLPKIGDKTQNPLYLSITEEMKELTGGPTAFEEEKIHGDPWEIRLPATLVKLRDDDKLPMWKWDAPSGPQPPGTYPPSPPNLWTWSEDTAAEQNE